MARQVKRNKRRVRKPIARKPDSELSGLLRTLRPRKPSGGTVVLQAYARRSVAA
jgi:hypothetical protein